MKSKRKFTELPMGTRFSYEENSDSIYVLLNHYGHSGCGLVAGWNGIGESYVRQSLCSAAESREEVDKLEVYVCVKANIKEKYIQPGNVFKPLKDNLEHIFSTQLDLQDKMNHPLGGGETCVKECMLALIVEATEVLNEINWKKWKQTHKEVDRQKLLTELNDVLQFWVNAVMGYGFTVEDVMKALETKWSVNLKRIEENY